VTTGPVLVTGAHGPAGRALMAQFDERGLPVLGVDMAVNDSSPRVLCVPPAKDPTYPDALRSVIEANGVEVLIPTVSEELRLVAGLRGGSWDGIRVVISPEDAVRVADETMRLSKTHLVLIPEGGHVQVIDIGATNGVYIEIDRERTRIPVHEPQRLAPGTLVHFGGRTLRLVS